MVRTISRISEGGGGGQHKCQVLKQHAFTRNTTNVPPNILSVCVWGGGGAKGGEIWGERG